MKGSSRRVAVVGTLLLTGAFAPLRSAETPKDPVEQPLDFTLPPRSDDVAVVIGISHYRDVGASAYSDQDAKLVKRYLLQLGFPERNIQLLLNDRATQSDLKKSIERWLPAKASPKGRVFFYYSGHGAPDVSDASKPQSYLLPYDGDPSDLAYTGYPIKRLYDRLGSLKAKEIIVVIDSCFSGAGGRSVLAKGARPLITKMASVALASTKMAVLSASAANQISTSDPDRKHGVMTYHFLEAIRTGTTKLADIYRTIKPKVEDDAKALNIEQSPVLRPVPKEIGSRFSIADGAMIALAREKKRKEDEERLRKEEEKLRIEKERQRMAGEKERLEEQRREDRRNFEAERERLRSEAAADAARQRRELERERERVRKLKKRAPAEEAPFLPPTF